VRFAFAFAVGLKLPIYQFTQLPNLSIRAFSRKFAAQSFAFDLTKSQELFFRSVPSV
jgi:hypothetical protein